MTWAGLAALLVVFHALPALAGESSTCGPTPYGCAVTQVERREFAAAIRSLQQQLVASPRDTKVLNLLGIALTASRRIDEANRRFRQALAIDPRFHPALKNLAINELAQGRDVDAKAHFEEVLRLAPTDDVAHLHLGEMEFRKKLFRSALPHYEKGRARLADDPAWVLHYARCLAEQSRHKEAAAVLGLLREGDAESRFEAGVLLGKAGASAEAAKFFASARKGYRDPHAAGYNQVLMLVRSGDYDAAIRVGQELAPKATRPAEIHNLVSQAYLKSGRIKEAYEALRNATRLEPTAEDNYMDLAAICMDHENYDLGLEIIDVGLHYRPESFRLHLQKGVLLASKGLVAQAETAFDRARELASDSPAPWVALAMAWMQTGQTQKAVDVLGERARVKADDAMIRYTFGVALVRSGVEPASEEGARAVETLEGAVRLAPDFAPARAELGKLLLKRDDVARAIQHLDKAVALDANDAGAAYLLAQAYRKMGNIARTQELLAKVSQLNAAEREPDSADALRRLVVRIVREGGSPPAQ